MARCTATTYGHRTESGRASCPACGGRSYNRYNNYSAYNDNYSSPSYSSASSGGGNKRRASWTSASSTISYTPEEIRTLTPVRKNVEERLDKLHVRDIFLCHAWDDRKGVAKELHDKL